MGSGNDYYEDVKRSFLTERAVRIRNNVSSFSDDEICDRVERCSDAVFTLLSEARLTGKERDSLDTIKRFFDKLVEEAY